jgi:oligopeptide/dipeptide ABC transporter ATP-binding protein
MNEQAKQAVFEIRHLQTWFPVRKGVFKRHIGDLKAVDDVSLTVYQGETLGIVGESGCGKSTLGKSIMRLENPTGGEVFYNFDGKYKDIMKFNSQELFQFRKRVQMVFQDPYSALNPIKRVYDSFSDPLKVHGYKDPEKRQEMIEEALRLVNIRPDYLMRFPHEFSGGQRQRLCIARALSVRPDVLVCDEPVSALDVSIQAQILNLMQDIQEEMGLTYLFITHDLSVVKHLSNQIMVMYLGQVVEICDAKQLFRAPVHPYTKALLSAIPIPDPRVKMNKIPLKGELSSPINPKPGCRFAKRCPYATPECTAGDIPLCEVEPGHSVACIKAAQFKDAMA